MITKTIKIYGIETQQCIFVATQNKPLTKAFIKQFEGDIRKHVPQFIPSHSEHMSTAFLGVVVTDQSVDENLIKEVRKYRKIKFIKYGLHGWAECYLAIVDLKKQQVYFHRKGRTYVEPFERNFKIKEE